MSGALRRWRPPLRMVLDTNVVVAALLWDGPPRRLLQWATQTDTASRVTFFTSTALLDELGETLVYSKFQRRMNGAGTSARLLVANYAALTRLVTPAKVPRVVEGDADDDHVIAAGVAARADLIVTGDRKHLLALRSHRGIQIVAASEALSRLSA